MPQDIQVSERVLIIQECKVPGSLASLCANSPGRYDISSHTTTTKGPMTIPLTPRPGTNTFGRDLFRIHGDNKAGNHTASHGCIILGPKDRTSITNCGGGKLQVQP